MNWLNKSGYVAFIIVYSIVAASIVLSAEPDKSQQARADICRPKLSASQIIEMGHSGIFSWTCDETKGKGAGYYIVFIRPAGTYVLLKVPIGKNSFEFTPDASGVWRWMVINTDPDRSKPDVESEPGHFQVIQTEQ